MHHFHQSPFHQPPKTWRQLHSSAQTSRETLGTRGTDRWWRGRVARYPLSRSRVRASRPTVRSTTAGRVSIISAPSRSGSRTRQRRASIRRVAWVSATTRKRSLSRRHSSPSRASGSPSSFRVYGSSKLMASCTTSAVPISRRRATTRAMVAASFRTAGSTCMAP